MASGMKSVGLLQPKLLREIAFLFVRQVVQTSFMSNLIYCVH